MNIVVFLLVGLIAGWLAGQIMKDKKRKLLGNLIVGVLGAIIGGFLFNALGLAAFGILGSIIMATIGAVVLLWLLRLINKK